MFETHLSKFFKKQGFSLIIRQNFDRAEVLVTDSGLIRCCSRKEFGLSRNKSGTINILFSLQFSTICFSQTGHQDDKKLCHWN